MAHDFLPVSRQIMSNGKPVDAVYGPFNSIQEFLSWCDTELIELYRGMTVGITQQDGTIIEYSNNTSNSVNTFVVKTQIPQLASVATSGSYEDLDNKPTIPTVNNVEVKILQNGVEKGSFMTNQSEDSSIDVGQGEETVFTAEFLKKVLTCRMNNKVYLTSKDIVSPNMLEYNGLAEPGASSTAWCGAGTEPTAAANTRIMIFNVNVDSWKGRTMTFTIKDGLEFAIASGEVVQTQQWDKSYPQQSDIPWNWHNHNDPVTIEIKDMISIMIRNANNGAFNWAYSYTAMWEWLEIEEVPTQQSANIAPKKLKDDRYVGSRVGVLGDSILAGASTRAYKTALDVLVSDYGIVPVPRCIAGSCIAPTSAAYSRDNTRFKNRIEINWQFTSSGYNGADNGVNRPYDNSLGVLIFGVNDVLMDKEPLDAEPFVRVTDAYGCKEMQINTAGLNPDGYLASLIELEGIVKAGAGASLNHFFLVGPYQCIWPGAYPMTTTGINPNGNTGEDYIFVQSQFCMIKGWTYLNILSSPLTTKNTSMSNDNLHPSQYGHQVLGTYLGELLCGKILTQRDYIFDAPKQYDGKKWTLIGDSLTARTSYTSKAYFDYIAEETGITVVNLGMGATGFLAGYDGVDNFDNFAMKVADIPADTDLLTVFGSFNDIASLSVSDYNAQKGTISDTGYSTICGAINEFFDELYTRFPAIRVGVISPTPWKTMSPQYTDSPAYDYVSKLKEICERKSVPFLDLFHNSNLRPWDADNRLAVYSKDLESGQTDPRGTHPDENGHKIIASKIREFIKTLI